MTGRRSFGLRLALRFPTTMLVTAPNVLLFLPLAIWNDNPQTDFIIQMWWLASAGTLAVEASIACIAIAEQRTGRTAFRPEDSARRWHGDRVAIIARVVTLLSVVANLASVLSGGGTLRAQVDSTLPSGILTVLSPFVSWAYIAVALLIAARHLGGLTRAAVLRWLGLLLVTQAAMAYVSNLTARATVFLVLLIVLAFLTDLVPRSWLVGGIAACALVWPSVYAIRNELRTANGIAVSDDISASDRLRFDEQIVRAAQYGPGHDLGQPGLWDAIRYGLVPRLFDPDRPGVSSGSLINEFLGGVSFSSYTFMPVATAWFFWGSLAVVLMYAAYAAIVMALRPWRALGQRPCALILFALMLGGPLAWFSTPPDVTINMLQTLVSAVPVFALLQMWARRPIPAVEPDQAPGGASRRSSRATPTGVRVR